MLQYGWLNSSVHRHRQDCWQRFSTAGEITFYLSSYRSKHADGLLLFQDSVAEINQ